MPFLSLKAKINFKNCNIGKIHTLKIKKSTYLQHGSSGNTIQQWCKWCKLTTLVL